VKNEGEDVEDPGMGMGTRQRAALTKVSLKKKGAYDSMFT
jgi:hypothetical protein